MVAGRAVIGMDHADAVVVVEMVNVDAVARVVVVVVFEVPPLLFSVLILLVP